MRIIDFRLTPGTTVYNIVCFCGFPFSSAADNMMRVKCPDCGRWESLRNLIKDYEATPQEKLARLRTIAAEARALHEKWVALPELEKDRGEGKEMGAKLRDYFAEAKGIIDELNPQREKVTT